MSLIEEIRAKLLDSLFVEHLEITDFSHEHAGHEGARPGGQSHLRVLIVAPIFEGMPRLYRHKMIHALLKGELASNLHALVLVTLTSGEYKQRKAQGKL